MAKLSEKEVLHVAELAQLKIDLKDRSKLHKSLSEVVAFIGQLSEVETFGVRPTSQTTGLENVFRIDEIKPQNGLSEVAALGQAGKTNNGFFSVGRVINK